MPEGLKLLVSADVTQAERNLKDFVNTTAKAGDTISTGLGKAEDAASQINETLKQLGKQGILNIRSIGAAIDELKDMIAQTSDPKDIQKLNLALNALKNKASELPPTFDKVTTSTQRASSSAIGLSRTFGLIPAEAAHITDKFEILLNVFDNVREKTGSTTEALKLLGGTLGTSIGIGLAITALAALGEKLFSSDELLKQIEKDFENVKSSIEAMNTALESLGSDLDFLKQLNHLSAELAGKKGATLEIIDLNQQKKNDEIRRSQIVDDLDKTKKSIDESLRKISIFSKLQNFDISFTEKGLIDQSTIDAASKIVKKQIEIFNSFVTEKNRLNNDLLKIDQDLQLSDKKLQIETNKQNEEARQKAIDDFDKFINETIKKAEKLSTFLSKRDILNIGAGFRFDPTKSKLENFEAAQAFIQKGLAADFPFIQIDVPPIKLVNPNNAKFEIDKTTIDSEIIKHLKAAVSKEPIIVPIPIDPKLIFEANFTADLNKMITSAIEGGIATTAESLGQALAGGDFGNVFKSFMSTIGSAVQAIGKKLIELGGIAKLVNVSLTKLFKNPALAIAAGVALITVGAALKKGIGGGLPGFAEGGFTGSGNPNEIAGVVHKGEFVIPADITRRLGRNNIEKSLAGLSFAPIKQEPILLMSKIDGNHILLSNARTNKYNGR